MMSMNARRADDQDAQFEMRTTKWRNPTDHVQKVTLFDATNRKLVVTWQPGEEKSVPSEYDRAIQAIDCGDDDCHKGGGKRGGGWYCTKGHPGNIVGGLAPLLVRVGVADILDPTLDPDLAAKKEAEAQMSAAALQAQAAERALLISAAKASGAVSDSKPASQPAKK